MPDSTITHSDVITIDVTSPYASQQLLEAYTTTGIAYFTGLPIATEAFQARVLETARRFFLGFTTEQKAALRFGVPGYIRGYSGPGSEQYGDTADTYQEHYVESLDIVSGMTISEWPDLLVDSGLMDELEQYRRVAAQSATIILTLTEKALKLTPGFLATKHALSRGNSTFRLNHYPSMMQNQRKGSIRFGEHTDFDTISLLLLLDDAGGLQFQNPRGEWCSLKRKPNTLLVHVADMLARWSNERLVATPHRVYAEDQDDLWPERYTMIFFAAPPSTTWVDSKDLFPDEPNKYPPVSAGDYLKQRLEQIYGSSYREKIG